MKLTRKTTKRILICVLLGGKYEDWWQLIFKTCPRNQSSFGQNQLSFPFSCAHGLSEPENVHKQHLKVRPLCI